MPANTALSGSSTATGIRTPALFPVPSGHPDIELVVYGSPTGKGRPRFQRQTGRAYTPAATEHAEARIQVVWIQAGRPRVEDGPIQLYVEAVLARPQNHWKTNGTLSAAGERLPWPTKRPDWDNLGKLIADALNGCAYRDDSQIVRAELVKRWAAPHEAEHTRIALWSLIDVPQLEIAA